MKIKEKDSNVKDKLNEKTKEINKYIQSLEKNFCRINNGYNFPGFLCKIPFQNENTLSTALISKYLKENKGYDKFIMMENSINFYLKDEQQYNSIQLDSRKNYASYENDVVIFEIKDNDLNINSFFEIDNNINKSIIKELNKKKLIYFIKLSIEKKIIMILLYFLCFLIILIKIKLIFL